MVLGALLCLLIAHFLADFPLQLRFIANLRYDPAAKKRVFGNTLHAGIHLLVSAVFVSYYWSWAMVYAVPAIAISHFLIDMLKSTLVSRRPFRKYSISIFFLDQIGHLGCIGLAVYVVQYLSPVTAFFKGQKDQLQQFLTGFFAGITPSQRVAVCLLLLLAGLWGIGYFIRLLLGRMSLMPYKRAINLNIALADNTKADGAADGGMIIGILERLFIMTAVVLNMPLVIGFILTVKSVARLKKFDDERFVEIFIIGSFISFISAIIIGYLIRAVLGLPIGYTQ